MNQCIFCKIVRNEISSEVVFEDSLIKVFKDIHPKAPIHLLIVPKKHIESVATLTDADQKTMLDVIWGAKKAAEIAGIEGYKLIFNVGRKGGQIVDHIHLHLLGGWKDKPTLDI